MQINSMQISIHLVCFHPPAFNYKTGAIHTSSESLNNFQCQLKATLILSIVTKRLSKSFEDCQSSLRIVWMGWQRPEREVFARKKEKNVRNFRLLPYFSTYLMSMQIHPESHCFGLYHVEGCCKACNLKQALVESLFWATNLLMWPGSQQHIIPIFRQYVNKVWTFK